MKIRHIYRNQAGDTLVEVLLATVVLSIVMAGAYTLSNRASNINQQSFDRSRASAFIQQQAEFVRAARDSFDSSLPPGSQDWEQVRSYAQPAGGVAPLGTDCNDSSILAATRGTANVFHIDPTGSINGGLYATGGFYNVWVEIETGSAPDVYEIHIFACWEGVGQSEIQKTKVILRLEENNG